MYKIINSSSKRFLACILSLIIIFSSCPMIFAAQITVNSEVSLRNALNTAREGTNLIIEIDGTSLPERVLTLTSALTLPAGTLNINIISADGQDITITSASNTRHFDITGKGDVTLTFDKHIVLKGNGTKSGGINSTRNINLIRARIMNCNPDSDGGGVYASGNITITDCEISGNTSKRYGGGICTISNNIVVTDSIISKNTANASSGGGICSLYGNVTVSNSTISDNKSIYSLGGGIIGTNVSITNSTISGNTASADGGGIFATNNLIVSDCSITKNTGGTGGGLCSANMTVTRSTISENSAFFGGGIGSSNIGNVIIDADVVFINNKSKNPVHWDYTDPVYAEWEYKLWHDEKIAAGTIFTAPHNNAYSNDDIMFSRIPQITYQANGGEGDMPSSPIVNNTAIVSANKFTAPEGKVFASWNTQEFDDGTTYAPGAIIEGLMYDMELYAIWKDAPPPTSGGSGGGGGVTSTYTVTFDSNGGTDVPNQKITRGTTATQPTAPTKPGYKFEGWYTSDEDLFDFATKINKSITLYAHWTKNQKDTASLIIVCLDQDGRTIYEAVTDEIVGDSITKLAPKLTGYDLVDDSSKTVTINPNSNTLYFDYNKLTGLVLDLRNHMRYIMGYPEGNVRPDQAITRAEATALFYRLTVADDKDEPLGNSFSDVGDDAWYSQHVKYMAKHGIVVGYEDGSFKPNDSITRAEFATIASRFDRLEESSKATSSDVTKSHWAFKYVNSASIKGWASGFPDGSFRPDESITRIQVVAIVNRMLDRRIELSDIPSGAIYYQDLPTSHWGYCDMQEASNEHTYKRKENGYEIWLETEM